LKHDPIDPGPQAAFANAALARPDENAFSPFRDRAAAGRLLAERLRSSVAMPAVVAAIPRGGVAVALPIVEELGLPLTVIYARKLTAPIAPEFAFGALDEDGEEIIDAETVSALGLRPADIAHAKFRVAAEIRRRMALYRVPPLAHYLPSAHVVLVDDGLATGLTMRAALAYARRHGASEITLAVPCASTQAAEAFRGEVDHFVSLVVDPAFMAVGAYFLDFSPVPDDAVRAMLERAKRCAPATAPSRSGLRVSFKSSRGHRLAGELLLPDGAGPHPVVTFAHGWGSSKASPRNRAVAESLRAAGLATFLFDFTGHGESEGSQEESTLAQQADDLRAALDVLRAMDDIDARRLGVVGASSGGAAALRFAAGDPRVRALVLRSANPAGAEESAYRIRVPTLLVVGDQDVVTRAANEELLPRLAGVRQLEVVPRGDHLFTDAGALARATEVTVGWMRKHLT
jgi:predicted phosphoribosyltransferase/dienelactone hydrolase